VIPEDRGMKVLSPSEVYLDPKKLDLPDHFYQLTPDDAKSLHESIAVKEDVDVLKTKEMREKEKLKKMQNFPKTTIRIRFPDKVMLQAEFYSTDKSEEIIKFVSEKLHSSHPFYLYTTPPPTKLHAEKKSL